MASLARIRDLYSAPSTSAPATSLFRSPLRSSASPPSTLRPLAPRAWYGGGGTGYGYGSGQPYEAASVNRRLGMWQPPRIGPTTSLFSSWEVMLARCRDEVRNNPLAASAVDNFESQMVGNGIRPNWNLPTKLKTKIEREFNRWANSKRIDWADKLSYYGMQALAAREIFEAGEVLVRRHIRPSSWGMRVPLQLQLIEAEQMPVWINTHGFSNNPTATPGDNEVRTGIEFDPSNRIIAYHMYKQNPGETMFYPLSGLEFMRVPAKDMLHVYKPWRAGLLRGQPHLSPVLVLLHEIQKYMDASVVKKQIQTMFAAFINKVSPDGDVLPPDMYGQNGGPPGTGGLPPWPYPPPGVEISHIETGTIQNLFPGESITFPNLPPENDIQTFLYVALHQLASGIGMTYEQLTGDLRGVNLSSIRAGVLDFRRKCEQFVRNILIAQFCMPCIAWFLEEAVMSGVLDLPGYAKDPAKYLDISWALSGWPWIDPKNDSASKQMEIRNGLTTRTAVCAERGDDAAQIDAQTVRDNARADQMGLVHDTDPRKVLIGKESNPEVVESTETPEGEKEAEEEQQTGSTSQDDAGS